MHPRGAIRPLPTFVLLVLDYLVGCLKRRRMYPCAESAPAGESPAPRVDAHAAGEEIGIGGWLP
eukprot:2464729-Alexandrium_andersonii.AAC.1